ncbi:hypothetical protein TrispH2_009964 [Trichoplax sp. H2]|uniref:Uncharacterized protein n=1 Tax=Trichoplax adhaerens TaxID=10228 RepID=B3SAW8_TRIAD|nr:predicted protein [Trichoplax adhaerens]EDV20227.1 predicted protein [Trichoplax adhaerens]RDD38331.1 hypothetical protein TrispH2_009964 [Trichoplax sp. H2]|eukprot:XP_002117388.1 predicted protein [Trichoplax adhaerens]
MEWIIMVLLLFGMGNFLLSVVSFVVLPIAADQTIRTLAFTGPILPAIAVLSLAFCLFYRKNAPHDTVTTAIFALSFWCLHLGLSNFIIYCSIFITNGYFHLSGPTILFIINGISTSAILIVAFISVNKYYLTTTDDDGNDHNHTRRGIWVRYSWADEYGCCDVQYKTLAVWQIFAGIVLTIIGMVGLFNVTIVYPVVAIAAGSMIFTSGIMGEFTAKLNSANTGNWFVAFSRIAMMACWLVMICDIVYMAQGATSFISNRSLIYVFLFILLAASIVGFFFAVYVEVLVGSRLGLHKFDSVRNGEEWMGYEYAIQSREFCFAVIQFISAMICFVAAVLAIAILYGDPIVVFTGLTGCLLMASGRTAANILRKKCVMTYSTYTILCVLTSFFIVANLIMSGYQLFLKISSNDASSTFLAACIMSIFASLIALPTTLYSVHFYYMKVKSLLANDTRQIRVAQNAEGKPLLDQDI